MDGSSLRALYLECCKPARVLDRQGDRLVDKLCEVMKELLRSKARGVVLKANGMAILFSYGSDTTPLLTWHTVKSEHKEGAVTRKAKKADDLLIEVGFLKTTTSAGEPVLAFLSRDPVPMSGGKSAWHMMPPLTAFFPLVQRIGHKGIVVTHYVFDRMAQSSMSKRARQRHGLYHLYAGGSEGGVDGGLPDLLDWVVSTACGNHDGQNALKWGLKLLGLDQAAVHRKLFITTASLRNAYDLLHNWLHRFVVTHLKLLPRVTGYDTAFNFWIALGVEAKASDLLADLGLFWDEDCLKVDEAHAARKDLITDIEHLLLTVFKFKSFSDSRWVTMGGSSRTITAGRQLGLDTLVKMVRSDPKSSDYYIHGYAELTSEAQYYSTVAGMVCNIADALLLELLEDPRFALRASEVKAAVHEEADWLRSVDTWVWDRLALYIDGVSGDMLRSKSLIVAQCMLAFMKQRLWDEVD